MSQEDRRYSRQDLLTAIEMGWRQYLPHLAQLSPEEQDNYAREQGFERVQDVLVHIFSWWERSTQRTYRLLGGLEVPRTDDIDAFNANAVAQYKQWSREDVEAKFTMDLEAFERFLSNLPEMALDNERIHLWLRLDAIDHYEEHRPPNAPSLRAADSDT
ncbi:ClbS/DfsB family four-helix bundle protein [Ktedonosporobacter rubrisoli]|uniref:ClbS/DfsB family four-helix bundle protein n=1 Tax=Ktedonosporobacter rubrisoli TaxID=2509675 RepID=A0A4P6JJG5_KTERU|nr:ClbS/DfsB family four-helix bundle protein [Ktedonosporobacter rubrisoli]QBD75239.1 ClbS/DfsB family four-helix bundle protein [Ktedonosporobacter rubrisoli]